MLNRMIHLAIDEFRRRFLGSANRTSRSKSRSSNTLKTLKNADDMSVDELADVFINAVNTHRLIPGTTMEFYQREIAASEDARHKVNVAMFQRESRRKHEPFFCNDQTIPVVFVRPATGADPFDVTESDYDDEVKDIQALSLKRISTTVELLFAAQHRVAVFMLFVIGRKFRFIRWDRAGLIFTPAIDYYDDQVTLCDLLGHVSRLDAVALGYDPSATRVLPGTAEFLQMESAARKTVDDVDHTERDLEGAEIEGPFVFEYARSMFRQSLVVDWPRHRLEVSSPAATLYYLVGKPTFIADGVMGRGTRGYIALDCQTGRFVWLKDVWRMSYMAADREGDILQRLNLAGIDGVPTLVCHGDVLEQGTVTSDWSSLRQDQDSSDANMYGPLRQHTHYRIAVEEVCLPLDSLANGKQLVSLVLDTLRTHYQAATNPQTRLLHCDVSSGNIMIYPKIKRNGAGGSASLVWMGVLSDWELSRSVDGEQAPSKATQAHRLGTYQFMSINLLQEPSRPVHISDELESFLHVIVYYAVCHLQSTCDRPSSWIMDYFYRYSGPQRLGRRLSTIETRGRLETVSPPGPLLFFSPLDRLLFVALQSFKAHYKVMDHDRQQARAPPPSPPPVVPMTAAQRRLLQIDYHVDEEIVAQLDAEHAARSLIEQGPTAEERELAGKLADHTFMLAHLEKFLQDPRWSDDDRIPPPPPPSSSRGDSQPNANPKATEVGKRPRPAESSSNEDRAAKRQRTSKSKPPDAERENCPRCSGEMMESFFRLLVYYAVRHLRPNCTDVSSWIDNYFHSYSGPERMLTCGQKSSAVEITGVLEIESRDGPLLFHSPMDGILAVILKSLRAHYKVMEHDAVKTAPPPPRPETPPPSPLISPSIMMRDFEDDLDDDLDDEQVAKWEARLQAGPPDRSPTSEDRELARKVADHKFMIDHLSRMLHDPRWRANDRVSAPQASESETPSSKAGAPPPSESAPPPSNKRQRTSGPERNVSLPARLRASTRRTRTRAHARTHPIRARQ